MADNDWRNHPHPSETSASAPKILVIEDESAVRQVIVERLRQSGYRVLEARDGAEGLRLVAEDHPRLVVLDVNMPAMGGYEVVETMRRRGCNQPVLMLSSQDEVDRRLKGLGLGADDFMSKPFDLREIVARIEVLLRRERGRGSTTPRRLRRGDVVIDLDSRQAERAGTPFNLTVTEFAILEALARSHGRPVTREQMLDAVWGYTILPNTRTVETHIWRLRKKLGDGAGEGRWIRNRAGIGYILATDPGETHEAARISPMH